MATTMQSVQRTLKKRIQESLSKKAKGEVNPPSDTIYRKNRINPTNRRKYSKAGIEINKNGAPYNKGLDIASTPYTIDTKFDGISLINKRKK